MTEQLKNAEPASAPRASLPDLLEKAPLERYVPPARPSLVGLSRAQLADALGAIGVPAAQRKMRVQQLWHWLYVRGATCFDQMTSVSKELRASLDARFTLARPEVVTELVSADGTRKWLLRLPGELADARSHEVECVYIPEADRGTLCLSSQVGCTLSCSFCHTGTQRLVRNLTPGEIVGQVMVARDRLGDWVRSGVARMERSEIRGTRGTAPAFRFAPCGLHETGVARMDPTGRRQRVHAKRGPMTGSAPPDDRLREIRGTAQPAGECRARERLISNIVMMGMGEPLYNFEAVRDALLVVSDGEGIAISKRRITLSTSGVVPSIARTGAEIGCMLAVSLHAVRDELRNQLVPLNRKYPIRELLAACRSYPGLANSRRITFEYVMLKGVNDSLADARALVQLLEGIPAKINLIPFNPWPGTRYECSDWGQIEKFSEVVFNAGYASPVRTPRGRDILAACGQLKSATERLSARERLALRAMSLMD
jgi:23S rRNA (adenine2503-C2)-methyltransferase